MAAAASGPNHAIAVTRIDGTKGTLGDLIAGKVAVIVNVASRCGFTKQYTGLEALHGSHEDIVVVGVPCNQFGAQEPGTDAEIKEFACSRYGASFPLLSKTEVNGAGAHPLYRALKEQAGVESIGWNFEKFLLDRSGAVKAHYKSRTTPSELETAAKALV